MATFPEEQLNSGYFPADVGQSLDRGTYTVIRKLGWGSRSSTWLVRQIDDGEVVYWASQIFTVPASKEIAERLLPILRNHISDISDAFPNFRRHFWETSAHGEHLCLIVSPYGLPILRVLNEALQSGSAGLPIYTVQYVANQVLDALCSLHSKKRMVMHGGVKIKNVVFTPALQAEELQPFIDANPPCATVIIDGLSVVQSQPLDHEKPDWDEPMSDVCNWSLDLVGYTDAQVSPYKTEEGVDYSSAPETLSENATCGPKTDIWMIGFLVFQLLTGQELIMSTGTREERLAQVQAVLQDGVLEQRLTAALTDKEAAAAASFLKKCLVLEPEGRSSSKDLKLDDEWVEEGGKCSCCYN